MIPKKKDIRKRGTRKRIAHEKITKQVLQIFNFYALNNQTVAA